jgi:hypothetical protein
VNREPVSVEEIQKAIRDHVQKFWGSTLTEHRWHSRPVADYVPGLKILEVRSKTPSRPVVYVTEGCFVANSTQHIRHELFLLAQNAAPRHVETLTMLANFHGDPRLRLDVGSIVNIGAPWADKSVCEHLLISLPYSYGPKLEWLRLQDMCVRFLWCLPISAREAGFAELKGYQALEERFESQKLNYLDPCRPSVV